MKIGVESNWGVGNFLFGMSLALSDIYKNKRKNELFLLEARKCGFDYKRNKKRDISDDFLLIFDPQIELKIIHDEKIMKNGNLYRGFNFTHDLSHCRKYIQNVLRFSTKAEQICEKFLNSVKFKSKNSKEFISINIRGGDFKHYYNNIDERLEMSYYDKIINALPNHLPVIISIVPQEELDEYKQKFKKYSGRVYFTNDQIKYPLCMPLTAKANYCCISNSTFHWWGGFLNKTGKVYYPTPWFKKFEQNMWFPKDWIPIARNNNSLDVNFKFENKKTYQFDKLDRLSVNEIVNTNGAKVLKLINKVNVKNSITVHMNEDGCLLVDGHPEMVYRSSGKDRSIIFHKKTKAKVGEIIKNSITKEYFVSLNVGGKTSATAWIGKEI